MNGTHGLFLSKHAILNWHRKNISEGYRGGNIDFLLSNCNYVTHKRDSNNSICTNNPSETKKQSGSLLGTCLSHIYKRKIEVAREMK